MLELLQIFISSIIILPLLWMTFGLFAWLIIGIFLRTRFERLGIQCPSLWASLRGGFSLFFETISVGITRALFQADYLTSDQIARLRRSKFYSVSGKK